VYRNGTDTLNSRTRSKANYTLGKANICDLKHSTTPMWWENILPTFVIGNNLRRGTEWMCDILHKQSPLFSTQTTLQHDIPHFLSLYQKLKRRPSLSFYHIVECTVLPLYCWRYLTYDYHASNIQQFSSIQQVTQRSQFFQHPTGYTSMLVPQFSFFPFFFFFF
jgi:hypothetical protein